MIKLIVDLLQQNGLGCSKKGVKASMLVLASCVPPGTLSAVVQSIQTHLGYTPGPGILPPVELRTRTSCREKSSRGCLQWKREPTTQLQP